MLASGGNSVAIFTRSEQWVSVSFCPKQISAIVVSLVCPFWDRLEEAGIPCIQECRLGKGLCSIAQNQLADNQLVHAHLEQVRHGKQILYGWDWRTVFPSIDRLEGTAEEVRRVFYGETTGKSGLLDSHASCSLVDPIVVCVCVHSTFLRFSCPRSRWLPAWVIIRQNGLSTQIALCMFIISEINSISIFQSSFYSLYAYLTWKNGFASHMITLYAIGLSL